MQLENGWGAIGISINSTINLDILQLNRSQTISFSNPFAECSQTVQMDTSSASGLFIFCCSSCTICIILSGSQTSFIPYLIACANSCANTCRHNSITLLLDISYRINHIVTTERQIKKFLLKVGQFYRLFKNATRSTAKLMHQVNGLYKWCQRPSTFSLCLTLE